MTTAHNQAQYHLTSDSPPTSTNEVQARQEPLRASYVTKSDTANEEWRAQIHRLKYEVDSLKQERDTVALRHQEELRKVQSRAEADYKRAQTAESASRIATEKYEVIAQQVKEAQEQALREKRDWERRVRNEQEQREQIQEELEELRIANSSQERQLQHEIQELEAQLKRAQQETDDVRTDRDEKAVASQTVQSRLSQREVEVGDLENEIMRLKTQTGDPDTFAVLKRELAEQVEHIKKLEAEDLDLRIEVKQFRKQQKSIDIVEEEKRSLEGKVRMMGDLRRELSEAQFQKQILEDERKSWTSYLENAGSDDEDLRFDTPEDLAKAFITERFEKLNLVDQLGKVSPELSAKDQIIRSLEEKLSQSKGSVTETNSSSSMPNLKARTRVERQRALAMKEVEYLRAQLKTFETEESEFNSEAYDEQKAKRVAELEGIVDQYRIEAQNLHEELSKAGESIAPSDSTAKSSKRPRSEEANDERIGELFRKTRTLQDSLSQAETAKSILEKELEACKSQLESVKKTSRTRVLELRDNPTAMSESVKQRTLNDLRSENAALLSQIYGKESSSSFATTKTGDKMETVPVATLTRLRGEMDAQTEAMAAKEKHILRLKQIFTSKSREFREAVASILGWKFDFMPNGRVRVTSLFNPGISEEEGGEGSNSIVFDGDNETMKVSGGPRSAFAGEIRPLVEHWIEGKNEIPCFLAACTLEFFDRNTGAQKV